MPQKIYRNGREKNVQLRNCRKQRSEKRKGYPGNTGEDPAGYYRTNHGHTSHVMKKKISYGFLLGLAVWALIIFLRKKGIIIPVISNHLTDFITVPMYAYLIEYVMNRRLGYQWKPDFKFILSSVLYLSMLFEVVCPMLSDRFTGDILDVAAYFMGGVMYYLEVRLRNFFKCDSVKNIPECTILND